MKKFFALAVMFALTASIVGCGGETKKTESKKTETKTTETKTEDGKKETAVEEKKEEKKEETTPAPVEEKKE